MLLDFINFNMLDFTSKFFFYLLKFLNRILINLNNVKFKILQKIVFVILFTKNYDYNFIYNYTYRSYNIILS